IEALMHYKFPKSFLRRTKSVFISFVPKKALERILSQRKKINYMAFLSFLKRRKIRCRLNVLREFWATWMQRHLTINEINFLQGRTAASIFERHYFNPSLLADLRTRCLEGVKKLLEEVGFEEQLL
ncbi:MAG: integrase, partial [Nitrososphaerota archaeon]|nr:integrase [Nitrososphaerota archaeon]